MAGVCCGQLRYANGAIKTAECRERMQKTMQVRRRPAFTGPRSASSDANPGPLILSPMPRAG